MRKLFLFGLILFLGLATAVAFSQTGGGFDLTWSTIDGGGGSSSGGNFALNGTIGQADAGELSGGVYALNGGFWQACAVPTAVANEAIQPSGGNVKLSWTSSSAAFNIYRAANDPFFTPGGVVYANSSGSTWTDPDNNVLGNVTTNYTYLIRADGNCGESADSQHLGEFDFSVVPGS